MSVHTCSYHCDRLECIRAQRDELRQAIEQAEKQEPVAYYYKGFHGHRGVSLHKETEEWQPLYPAPVHASDISQERVDETAKGKHEWVGLTDYELPEGETYDFDRGVRWAEAKLKEKNHDTR
jgi:hypothetical protein